MKKYNEKELLKLSVEQASNFNKMASGNLIDSIPASLPCWIHFNNLKDLALEFMNVTGLNNFRESWDDIRDEGVQFLYRIVHPETAEKVVPLCNNFIKADNSSEVLLFEQKIKYSNGEDYHNHLSFAVVNKLINKLFVVTVPAAMTENFIRKRIFPEDVIFEKFYEKYLTLSKREKEILKLVTSGKSNKEVSNLLMISYNTVKTHRKSILNKLETNNLSDLTRIAVYFNLVDEN